MVSTGSSLRAARRPGWEPAYLDYETLKLLLSQIEAVYVCPTLLWLLDFVSKIFAASPSHRVFPVCNIFVVHISTRRKRDIAARQQIALKNQRRVRGTTVTNSFSSQIVTQPTPRWMMKSIETPMIIPTRLLRRLVGSFHRAFIDVNFRPKTKPFSCPIPTKILLQKRKTE